MLLPNIILQHGSIIFTFQRAFYQSSQSARGKFLFSYLSQTFAVSFKQKNRGQKRPPFAPFSPRFFPEISLKKFCFLRITFISCRLLLCVFLFASPAGQKRYNFTIPRRRKHIHTAHLLHPVSSLLQHHQIPRQAGRLAGDIDHPLHAEIDDFPQCLRMNAVSGRVQND